MLVVVLDSRQDPTAEWIFAIIRPLALPSSDFLPTWALQVASFVVELSFVL